MGRNNEFTMKLKRSFVTPYITWTFLVIGLSGMLMLFHLGDGYTEVLHELFGLLFVVFSVFHIIINWKSLKNHFTERTMITSFIVVLFFSILVIIIGNGHGAHERVVMEKLLKAPIANAFEILEIDPYEAEETLENNHIVMGDSKTIEDIGLNNQTSPMRIIELIVK